MLREVRRVVADVVGCAIAYNIVEAHYVRECTGFVTLFGLDTSPYCGMLRNTLGALRSVPAAMALAVGGGVGHAVAAH